MEEWLHILRVAGISHLFVLLMVMVKGGVRAKGLQAAVFFVVCCMGYLAIDLPGIEARPLLFYPLLILPILLPVAFWLASRSLFRDGFALRPWYGWLALAYLVVQYGIIFTGRRAGASLPDAIQALAHLFPYALSLSFVILGITEALRGRTADLVLPRQRFRVVFVLITATLIGLTLLSEVAFQEVGPPVELEALQKATILLFTLFFSIRLLHFRSGFFPEPAHAQSQPVPEVDSRLVARLMNLIETDKAYRTEGLTISQLATQLDVKEYKLRQAINQHLGFRNFNDFLNQYRIEEAKAILSDPANKERTILEIAYSLGYQSLSPFNKAFKESAGKTPSEFRKG